MSISSDNIGANLFDQVRVAGQLIECTEKYIKIARADAEISVQSKTFQVGDCVVVWIDGKQQQDENGLAKIYRVKKISINSINVCLRTGRDFGFDGLQGEMAFGQARIEHATEEQIASYDAWYEHNALSSEKYRSALDHCAQLVLTEQQIDDLARTLKYRLKF